MVRVSDMVRSILFIVMYKFYICMFYKILLIGAPFPYSIEKPDLYYIIDSEEHVICLLELVEELIIFFLLV